MATTTRTIAIPQQLDPVTVLGPVDEVLREVERAFPDLTIIVRGNRIAIQSRSSKSESQAAQAEHVIETHPSRIYGSDGRRYGATHARSKRVEKSCGVLLARAMDV